MNSKVGTWSPLDLVFPSISSDVDYAQFYITEDGVLNNISYKIGDWLIFIRENSEEKWFKTSGSVITVNLNSNLNSPDPGFYTKVRLDNNGNIISAETLSSDDIPSHTHNLSDIENITDTVKDIIGTMIASPESSQVKLKYNSDTKTITATVNIDEDTIKVNEYGQLYSNSSSSSTIPATITISDVESLSERLEQIENEIKSNVTVVSSDSAIKKNILDNNAGVLLKVKYDGSSIILNGEGELSINPDVLISGDPSGSTTPCGNITVTPEEINGLDDYIISVLKANVSLFAISVNDIPIDEETIVINSNGKLSAVAAKTQAHTHTTSDITNLNEYLASWASSQGFLNWSSPDYDTIIVETSVSGVKTLKVNPAFIQNALDSADYTDHTHTVSQIENFTNEVINVIKNSGLLTVDTSKIKIDNNTIILNTDGELEAVQKAPLAHTHVLNDISDLNQERLEWAGLQTLHNSSLDYSNGLFDLSTYTISKSLELFNNQLKNINDEISSINNSLSQFTPAEPSDISESSFYISNYNSIPVISTSDASELSAVYSNFKIYTDYFYPKGKIEIYLNDELTYSFDMENKTFSKNENVNGFLILDVKDAYKGQPLFESVYNVIKIQKEIELSIENSYNLKINYTLDNVTSTVYTKSFNFISVTSPELSVNLTQPSVDNYVSGLETITSARATLNVSINNAFTSLFIPKSTLEVTYRSGINTLSTFIIEKSLKKITYNSYTFDLNQYTVYQSQSIKIEYYCEKYDITSTKYIYPYKFDISDIEEYRYMYHCDSKIPSDKRSAITEQWNSQLDLSGYNAELQVENNNIMWPSLLYQYYKNNDTNNQITHDYSSLNYYTYNNKKYMFIMFSTEASKITSVYADIEKSDGSYLSLNKDGTLNDILIFIGSTYGNLSSFPFWMNGNSPYVWGTSVDDSFNFPCLDLFKSTNSRRYFTIGKNNSFNIDRIYLYIGIPNGYILNGEKILSSFLESVNG